MPDARRPGRAAVNALRTLLERHNPEQKLDDESVVNFVAEDLIFWQRPGEGFATLLHSDLGWPASQRPSGLVNPSPVIRRFAPTSTRVTATWPDESNTIFGSSHRRGAGL
ncbi:hypothetical protein [Amycolatopsis sp. CA-128772]|uniref:hypothetical protein n=1 Tax=Amycolatopsis sp. CA-128772 TaxID=2073159 RepID=UPI0011B0CD6B|nr:hypothetical protein [Amycolatopsis sp. CA-128772]